VFGWFPEEWHDEPVRHHPARPIHSRLTYMAAMPFEMAPAHLVDPQADIGRPRQECSETATTRLQPGCHLAVIFVANKS